MTSVPEKTGATMRACVAWRRRGALRGRRVLIFVPAGHRALGSGARSCRVALAHTATPRPRRRADVGGRVPGGQHAHNPDGTLAGERFTATECELAHGAAAEAL